MDKTEYITKCAALLQDNSVYQHLSKDTSPTIHKELIKILQDYKNPQKQHAYGTATYNTAKFITKILQNYCDKTSSFGKDSTDFIKKNKHLSINPEEETLVSFDVSVLFSSIPVHVVLQVINSKISTCTNFTNVCMIPTVKFIKLLERMNIWMSIEAVPLQGLALMSISQWGMTVI